VNPDLAYDCGKPHGEIWKVGWAGIKDRWPGAYKAIKAFTLDNAEMGQMITEVDLNGKTVQEVADAWMAANEARWSTWIQ
jgi:glycine betaine/proline transport system substrate-binding protein